MKFYSYFDGKTQFSQIFLGFVFFVFFFFFLGGGGGGGGVGGQITASFTCAQNYYFLPVTLGILGCRDMMFLRSALNFHWIPEVPHSISSFVR